MNRFKSVDEDGNPIDADKSAIKEASNESTDSEEDEEEEFEENTGMKAKEDIKRELMNFKASSHKFKREFLDHV
jgi:hypothetical protein